MGLVPPLKDSLITATWGAEAGGLQVKDLPGIKSKNKVSPGKLARLCLKMSKNNKKRSEEIAQGLEPWLFFQRT